jgi:hypothetical protein
LPRPHWRISSPTSNFTTQFYFPDTLTEQIYQMSPYNQRTSGRDTTNAIDNVYTAQDCLTGAESGTETMFNITTRSGYGSANYNIILDLSSTSSCNSSGGGGTGPGGRAAALKVKR